MKISVLGTGSAGNLYTVNDQATTLLIECGKSLPVIKRDLNFRLSEVKACLITHEHGDHSKGAKQLIKTGIDFYASEGTLKALKLQERYNIHHFKKNGSDYSEEVIETFIVKPFSVFHDAEEPVGFYIYSNLLKEKVLYVTDTGAIPYNFSPVHYMMIEINYSILNLQQNYREGMFGLPFYRKVRETHLNSDQVIDFLNRQDLTYLKELYIIHRSDRNSSPCLEEELREVIPEHTKLIL